MGERAPGEIFFFNRPLATLKTFLPKHTDRFKAIVRKSILARDLDICESKLFKHNGGFYLNLVVQKEMDVPEPEITDKTVITRALFGKYLGIFLKIINAEHTSKRTPIRLRAITYQ